MDTETKTIAGVTIAVNGPFVVLRAHRHKHNSIIRVDHIVRIRPDSWYLDRQMAMVRIDCTNGESYEFNIDQGLPPTGGEVGVERNRRVADLCTQVADAIMRACLSAGNFKRG